MPSRGTGAVTGTFALDRTNRTTFCISLERSFPQIHTTCPPRGFIVFQAREALSTVYGWRLCAWFGCLRGHHGALKLQNRTIKNFKQLGKVRVQVWEIIFAIVVPVDLLSYVFGRRWVLSTYLFRYHMQNWARPFFCPETSCISYIWYVPTTHHSPNM